MIVSVKFNEADAALLKLYAGIQGISAAEVLKKVFLDKMEDEYDLKCLQSALEYNRHHPKVYSVEEVDALLEA